MLLNLHYVPLVVRTGSGEGWRIVEGAEADQDIGEAAADIIALSKEDPQRARLTFKTALAVA